MTQYIHISDKRFENPSPIPVSWENISRLNLSSPADIISRGWRICEFINETYDPDIQNRSVPVKDIQATKAVFNYTITDKPLNQVKKWKGQLFMREGWNLLLEKYPEEFDREGSAYNADRATLKNYIFNTLKPKIQNASTVQNVKNLKVVWPTL